MTRIKVCGLRREKDIIYVNRYYPEYVGYVFSESKRRVSPQYVKSLNKKLNTRIKKVGVFVNKEVDTVINIVQYCNLNVIQLHGDESNEYISILRSILKSRLLNIEIWKAIRVKDSKSLYNMGEYNVDKFLLDVYSKESYGGTGNTFDWDLAVKAKKYGDIILAGGLNKENIEYAINKVKPYAIDISSGVETNEFKDEYKIKEFIDKVRGGKIYAF